MDAYYDLVKRMKALLGGFYSPVVTIVKIAGILVLSIVIIRVGSFIIRKIFKKQKALRHGMDEKKINTMASLAASVFRYAVYIMAGIIILTDIFNLTSVLAAAGVGGVALGLGAQSLIKDVISGFFIVLEDQYAVGDLVTVLDRTGTVEELELRVTKLRSFNGDLYIIPNGEIKMVVNHTRGDKAILVDIPIAYSADISKAVEIAEKVCDRVSEEYDTITEPPKVLGVTELGKESLSLRVFGRTRANAQWDVERRIRMLVKEEYDKAGIVFYDRNRIFTGRDFTAALRNKDAAGSEAATTDGNTAGRGDVNA